MYVPCTYAMPNRYLPTNHTSTTLQNNVMPFHSYNPALNLESLSKPPGCSSAPPRLPGAKGPKPKKTRRQTGWLRSVPSWWTGRMCVKGWMSRRVGSPWTILRLSTMILIDLAQPDRCRAVGTVSSQPSATVCLVL